MATIQSIRVTLRHLSVEYEKLHRDIEALAKAVQSKNLSRTAAKIKYLPSILNKLTEKDDVEEILDELSDIDAIPDDLFPEINGLQSKVVDALDRRLKKLYYQVEALH